MVNIRFDYDEDLVKRSKKSRFSVGLTFAIEAFVIPVFLTLLVLGVVYSSNPYVTGMTLGLLSAETLIYIALRPTMRERLIQVWQNYLRPIRDSASNPFIYGGFRSDLSQKLLKQQAESLKSYGKYGIFALYPTTILRNYLVNRLISNGRDFNERLDQLVAVAKIRGVELNLHVAFQYWGFRPIF